MEIVCKLESTMNKPYNLRDQKRMWDYIEKHLKLSFKHIISILGF